jgi:hypothetical protein
MQEAVISTNLKTKLSEAYKLHLLEHGEAPASVFKFCKDLGISEAEFYKEFSGFDALDKALVDELHFATAKILNSDETYKSYDTRGKLLAYMFSFIEVCNSDRSFLMLLKHKAGHSLDHGIGGMKQEFTVWAKTLVFEGIEKGDRSDPQPSEDLVIHTVQPLNDDPGGGEARRHDRRAHGGGGGIGENHPDPASCLHAPSSRRDFPSSETTPFSAPGQAFRS